MILLSYDGSTDAQAAIERAAVLMPGAEATVLTVWEPFIDTIARSSSMGMGLGWGGSYGNPDRIDASVRRGAEATAADGAQRAQAAGLSAAPRCDTRHGSVADAILAAAEDIGADAVVMGTRGLGGVKSILLGSVSHAVMQHADRPVLVVPSPALAGHRRAAADGIVVSVSSA